RLRGFAAQPSRWQARPVIRQKADMSKNKLRPTSATDALNPGSNQQLLLSGRVGNRRLANDSDYWPVLIVVEGDDFARSEVPTLCRPDLEHTVRIDDQRAPDVLAGRWPLHFEHHFKISVG